MARDGSGTYNLPATNPVVTNTDITITWANGTLNDIKDALTASIAKDGQTTPSANLPMGTYRHTGVGNASARTCYASVSDVQDGTLTVLGSVSGADTITATAAHSMAAYATGQEFVFVSAGANTGAATLNINAIGAKAITKNGTTALAAGDIPSGAAVKVVYDGTRFQMIGCVANKAQAGANSDITSLNAPAIGAATATTQAPGDNTTKVATTAYADAAAAAVAYTPATGSIVQTVFASTGSLVTGATTIPMDNSIPQQSEGVEAITVAITPTDAGNDLLVEAGGFFAHNANSDITLALFRDATADAIGATMATPSTSDKCQGGSIAAKVAAGGTSATTFKLRAGSNGAGTLSINGRAAGQLFGGVGYTWIKVTEIKA